MAPRLLASAVSAAPLSTTHMFSKGHEEWQRQSDLVGRSLSHPNHTQQVTLGVIAAYVVVIAILWNVPYIKNILWPFKVSPDLPALFPRRGLHQAVEADNK